MSVEVQAMTPSRHAVAIFRGEEGFTVIRLMVTLAIASLMLGAASPNIATVTRIYGVRSAARQVYAELQNARMAAVTENRSYTFAVDDGGTSYSVGPSGATVSKTLDAASQGVTISAGNALTFTSTGTASSTETITVTNSRGDTVAVSVSPGGRVKIG
jgi:Tfp pilus assembly protein FimT